MLIMYNQSEELKKKNVRLSLKKIINKLYLCI